MASSTTQPAAVTAEAQAQPVVLITGAASGIGRSAALQFAEAKCRVVVVDVDETGAQDTCKAVESVGGVGFHMACDVSDEEEVQNLLQIVRGHFGRLDFALHTASIRGPTAPLHEYPTADFDSVLSTNVRGYFLCMKYEIPLMLATSSHPCVVLLASTEGHTAVPGMVGYVTSKWAIRGLAQTAAADYGPKGLRVNVVSPGTIGTITPLAGTSEEAPEHNPDEVASYVVWLCRNGRGISGTELVMDTVGLRCGGSSTGAGGSSQHTAR